MSLTPAAQYALAGTACRREILSSTVAYSHAKCGEYSGYCDNCLVGKPLFPWRPDRTLFSRVCITHCVSEAISSTVRKLSSMECDLSRMQLRKLLQESLHSVRADFIHKSIVNSFKSPNRKAVKDSSLLELLLRVMIGYDKSMEPVKCIEKLKSFASASKALFIQLPLDKLPGSRVHSIAHVDPTIPLGDVPFVLRSEAER